jgi:hypothetical protein
MIGSGIPISQSSAPFPNDIIVSILYRLDQQLARVPLVPLPASRAAGDRKPPRTPLTVQPSERVGGAPLQCLGRKKFVREPPGTILRPGVQYDRDDRQRTCSASTLTTDFAKER